MLSINMLATNRSEHNEYTSGDVVLQEHWVRNCDFSLLSSHLVCYEFIKYLFFLINVVMQLITARIILTCVIRRADASFMHCAGVKTMLKPEKHQRARLKQLTPQRLDFMVENKIKVNCKILIIEHVKHNTKSARFLNAV